jgi:hypothetical protein
LIVGVPEKYIYTISGVDMELPTEAADRKSNLAKSENVKMKKDVNAKRSEREGDHSKEHQCPDCLKGLRNNDKRFCR